MEPRSGIQMVQTYKGPLELATLTSESEWRKLWIEACLKDELEEDLVYILCCCLEEATRRWGLGDLV